MRERKKQRERAREREKRRGREGERESERGREKETGRERGRKRRFTQRSHSDSDAIQVVLVAATRLETIHNLTFQFVVHLRQPFQCVVHIRQLLILSVRGTHSSTKRLP